MAAKRATVSVVNVVADDAAAQPDALARYRKLADWFEVLARTQAHAPAGQLRIGAAAIRDLQKRIEEISAQLTAEHGQADEEYAVFTPGDGAGHPLSTVTTEALARYAAASLGGQVMRRSVIYGPWTPADANPTTTRKRR